MFHWPCLQSKSDRSIPFDRPAVESQFVEDPWIALRSNIEDKRQRGDESFSWDRHNARQYVWQYIVYCPNAVYSLRIGLSKEGMFMQAKINGQEILKKLSVKSDRAKTTLYLSKSLYEEFKLHCGEVASSQVLEELMRQFVASTGRKKK